MQLTRFDHWLRNSFVYETHIKTLRAAATVPRGIRAIQLPDVPGVRFKYLYIARNTKRADAFIASLRDANLMFFTSVEDRKGWFARFVAPRHKSFTWRFAWLVLTTIFVCFVTQYLVGLFSQPAIRKMCVEALETLKG